MSISEKIRKIKPGYLPQFDDFVKKVAQFGGGSDTDKYVKVKSFSNAYEVYIYAYFLGLYTSNKFDLTDDDKLKTFWEMENWKPIELVDSIITCAIATSDFDMLNIENGNEQFISSQIKILKREIESYANGGLAYLTKEFEEDPELLEDDTYFISLLNEAQS